MQANVEIPLIGVNGVKDNPNSEFPIPIAHPSPRELLGISSCKQPSL